MPGSPLVDTNLARRWRAVAGAELDRGRTLARARLVVESGRGSTDARGAGQGCVARVKGQGQGKRFPSAPKRSTLA